MLIKGGDVFLDGAFKTADILISGERVSDVHIGTNSALCGDFEGSDEVLDATGCYVIPGLIDLHFHGVMGSDLSDATPEAISTIATYEASRGVTAICPATMTLGEVALLSIMKNAASFKATSTQAELVGINMEGPYISPSKVGAQNPAFVRHCDIEEFERLQDAAGGLIKLVDIAPEEPDALDFIRAMHDKVRISIAHTATDYACAVRAFELGARHITHLFNAMPGLHHRNPGPIPAAAERNDITPEIIADGVHIHPAMVRLAFEMFGDDRMILISDSLRACGLGDGEYELGGQRFTVRGPRATLADGTLAGSCSDLMACLRTAVRDMSIPLESAVKAATINPARVLGVDGERGSFAAGNVADCAILDEELNLKHVVLRGSLLF